MMKRISVAAVLLFVSASAAASPKETHEGFFLRLQLGLGSVSTSVEEMGRRYDYGGAAGEFSVAIGGAIAPNLILFGEVVSHAAPSPNFSIDGVKNPKTIEIDGSLYEPQGPEDMSLTGIGPGISYYFMPVNIFASASINIATVSFRRADGLRFESDPGYTGRLALGKEWWVGDGTGLGVSATGTIGRVHGATTTAFGLGGSLTFN